MKGFLPDQTHLSQVHLRTAGLDRALEFYSGLLGLRASRPSESEVGLFGRREDKPLLVLSEDRKASAPPPQRLGLYHLALRYETRNGLANAFRRVRAARYPLAGTADHGVSETIYLRDPDGNGVELYADYPRSRWPRQNGLVSMVTEPLNLEQLLATEPGSRTLAESPLPDLGHIHLQVADLRNAETFYSEFLGLAVTQRSYPGALFFAAGDYHHHIAVNVWGRKTAAPQNSVGLVSYRLEVPVAEIIYCLGNRAPLLRYEARLKPASESNPVLQIRDPNGHWLEVQASAPRTDNNVVCTSPKAPQPAQHLPGPGARRLGPAPAQRLPSRWRQSADPRQGEELNPLLTRDIPERHSRTVDIFRAILRGC